MSGPQDAARAIVAVTRSRGLRRVLVGFGVFSMAEWATWVAMLVYAYDRGGASAAGLVAVIQLVPATVFAPVGSILGDRMRRDHALALGYAAQATTMGVVSLTLQLDAPVAAVYLAAAMTACAVTLSRPVHYALLPELADTPDQLTAANSASSTLEGLAVFTGPAITGLLLILSGAAAVFALMAALLILVSAFVVRLPHHELAEGDGVHEPLVGAAIEGVRALRRDRGAGVLTLLVGAQFVVVGMMDILAVVLALQLLHLGRAGPGLMTAAAGVGGLLGAAATVVLIGRRRMTPGVMLGVLLTGVPLILVAVAGGPLMAFMLLALSGAGKAFFDVAGRTLLQRAVDDAVLSRVFGLQEALVMAGLAVGSAVTPLLVDAFGGRGAYVAAGAFLPVAGAMAWRSVAGLDRDALLPGPEFTLLRRVPIFQPLPQPSLERLASSATSLRASVGSVIIREGDPGDRFYLVLEGRADVTVGGRLVAALGEGEYFGEIALLRNVPRTATVVAGTDLRLLALERADFLGAVAGLRASEVVAEREAARRLASHDRGSA